MSTLQILILLVIVGAVSALLYKNSKKNSSVKPGPTDVTPSTFCEDCDLVKFDTRGKFSYTAHWKDSNGVEKSQFVELNTTLEVCAKSGTANGGPFTVLGKC